MFKNRELSPVLWMVVPVAFSVYYFLMPFFNAQPEISHFLRENGPVENFQALTMFASFALGAYILKKFPAETPRWMFGWVALATACSLYVGLEEISYGQQIFKWATPAEWGLINDHDETNLHNSSKVFDQWPKTVMEIGIYGGGLVIPLLAACRPKLLPGKAALLYPSAVFVVTALCLLFFRVSRAFGSEFEIFKYSRLSEVKEALMYWFVFLYLILLKKRLLGASNG